MDKGYVTTHIKRTHLGDTITTRRLWINGELVGTEIIMSTTPHLELVK